LLDEAWPSSNQEHIVDLSEQALVTGVTSVTHHQNVKFFEAALIFHEKY
jgi:hypothetical protein